jgi:tRNA A-37 threonylcarbamoyl transferase component Bud32
MQDKIITNPEVKCFYSRRNRVTLNEMKWDKRILPVITKEYSGADAALREYRLLKHLERLNINVPLVYGADGKVLYLQYIEGVLLNNIIDDVTAHAPNWISELACWFYRFHKANLQINGSVLLKDDANLRNFIFFLNSFYALDFENEVFGRPEQDIAECCAYILSNAPGFNGEKFKVVNKLVDYYCHLDSTADKEVIKTEIKKNLKILAGRRKYQEAEIYNSLPLINLLLV